MLTAEIITTAHTNPFEVLNSMVTPAVLIAVCASMTVGTSQRLNRVIERTRKLFEEYRALKEEKNPEGEMEVVVNEGKKFEMMLLNKIIDMQTRRVQFLQKSLTSVYISMGSFVATCLTIGVVQIGRINAAWVPLSIGIIAAVLLFYSCLLLISETIIALDTVGMEMQFIRGLVFSPDKAIKLKDRGFWRQLWIRG